MQDPDIEVIVILMDYFKLDLKATEAAFRFHQIARNWSNI